MEQLWDVIQAKEAARLAVQMLAEAANRSKMNKQRCQEIAEAGKQAFTQLELAVRQRAPDKLTLLSIAAQLSSVANQSRARVEQLGNAGAIGRFAAYFRRKQVEDLLAKERHALLGLLNDLGAAAANGSGGPPLPVLPNLTSPSHSSLLARQVIGREGRMVSASCESVGSPSGDEVVGDARGGGDLLLAPRTLRVSDNNPVQHVSFMRGAASESGPLQLMVALPKQVEVYSFQLDAFHSDTPLVRPEQLVTATTLYEPTVDLVVGHNGGTVSVYGRVGSDMAQPNGTAGARGVASSMPLLLRASRNAVTALHCVPAVELDIENSSTQAPSAAPHGITGGSTTPPAASEVVPATPEDNVSPGGVGSGTVHDVLLLAGDAVGRVIAMRYSRMQPEVQAGLVFTATRRSPGEGGGSLSNGNMEHSNQEITCLMYRSGLLIVCTVNGFIYVVRMVPNGSSGSHGGAGEGAGANGQSGTAPTRPQHGTSGGGTALSNHNMSSSTPTVPSLQDGLALAAASSVNLLSPTTSAAVPSAVNRSGTTFDNGIRKSPLLVSTVLLESYYSGDMCGHCTALVALEWGSPGAALPLRSFADSCTVVPTGLRGARVIPARQAPWRMLSAHVNGQLLMWDVAGGKLQLVCTIGDPGPYITSVCTFPNLGTMVEVLQNGHLRVGPLPTSSLAPPTNPMGGVPVWRLRQTLIRAHHGVITSAASLQNGIATGSRAGGVKVWDAAVLRSQAVEKGVPFLSLAPRPTAPGHGGNGSIASGLLGVMTNGTTSPGLSTRNLNCYNGGGGGGSPSAGGAVGANGQIAVANGSKNPMPGPGPGPQAPPLQLAHMDLNFNNSLPQQGCAGPESTYQASQHSGSHGGAPVPPHSQLQHMTPMHSDPYAVVSTMPAMYPLVGGQPMRPSGPLNHISRGVLAGPTPDSIPPLPPAIGAVQSALASPADSLKAPVNKYQSLQVQVVNGAASEDGMSAAGHSRQSSYGGGAHLPVRPRSPAPHQAHQAPANTERHANGHLDTGRQATKANTYTASAMEEAVKAAMEFAGGGSGVGTSGGGADDNKRECSSKLPFVPPAGMSAEEVEANHKADIREAPRTAPSSPRPVLTPLSPRVQQYSPNLFRITSMGGSHTSNSPYPMLDDGWGASLAGAQPGPSNRSITPVSPLSAHMHTPFHNYVVSGAAPHTPHGAPPQQCHFSCGGGSSQHVPYHALQNGVANSHHMAYHALQNGGANSHHMAYHVLQNGGASNYHMAYPPPASRISELGGDPSNGYYEAPIQHVPGPSAPVQPLQRRLSTLSDYDNGCGFQDMHQSGLADPAIEQGEPFMPTPPVLPPPAPDPTAAPPRITRNEVNPLLQNAFIRPDDLRLIDPIGQGAEGTVWRGRWHHIDVAVKEMHPTCESFDRLASIARDLNSPDSAGNSEVVTAVVREVSALIDLGQHPNIIRFVGVCAAPPRIITEYYKMGSLFTMLKEARQGNIRTREKLTWYRRLVMLQDIAAGMSYLHARNYIHGDLRSPNVFVTEDQHLKIGDFGFAKILGTAQNPSEGVPARLTNPRWQAPEVYSMDRPKATTTADVYSFGIIMYELLTFQQPYHDVADDTVVMCRHTLNPNWRPAMPADHKLPVPRDVHLQAYKALMMDCWAENPDERPSFHKVAERLMALIRWQRVLSVVRRSLWGARPLRRTTTPIPEAAPSGSATANGSGGNAPPAAEGQPSSISSNAAPSLSNGTTAAAPTVPAPDAISTRQSSDSTGSNPEAGQLSHILLEMVHTLKVDPNLLLEMEREAANKQNGAAQVAAARPSGTSSRGTGPVANEGSAVPSRRRTPSAAGETALESAPTFANNSAFRSRVATIGPNLPPIRTQQQGQGAKPGAGTAVVTQSPLGTGADAFTLRSPFNAMGTLSDDEDDARARPPSAAARLGKSSLAAEAPTVSGPSPQPQQQANTSVPSAVTPSGLPHGPKGSASGAGTAQQWPGSKSVVGASSAAASKIPRASSASAAMYAAKAAALKAESGKTFSSARLGGDAPSVSSVPLPATTQLSQGFRGGTAAHEVRSSISHPEIPASMGTSRRDLFTMSSPFNGMASVDSDDDAVPGRRPAAPAPTPRGNSATTHTGSAPPVSIRQRLGPKTDDAFAMRTPFHPSFLPNLDEDD